MEYHKFIAERKPHEPHPEEEKENSEPKPPKERVITEEEQSYYESLEIYRDYSFGEFLNKLWINRYCCFTFLIDQAPRLLSLSKCILGENITFGIVNRTIGKVFTGGETLTNLES